MLWLHTRFRQVDFYNIVKPHSWSLWHRSVAHSFRHGGIQWPETVATIDDNHANFAYSAKYKFFSGQFIYFILSLVFLSSMKVVLQWQTHLEKCSICSSMSGRSAKYHWIGFWCSARRFAGPYWLQCWVTQYNPHMWR